MNEILIKIKHAAAECKKDLGTDKGMALSLLYVILPVFLFFAGWLKLPAAILLCAVLLCFLKHPRQVFTRTALLDQIWGYDFAGDTRTVDIHVQRIRKKAGLEGMLVTVFGVGYKYVPQ